MVSCFVSIPVFVRHSPFAGRLVSPAPLGRTPSFCTKKLSHYGCRPSWRMVAENGSDSAEEENENVFTDAVQGPSQAPTEAGVSTVGLSDNDAKFITACYDADVKVIESMLDDGQDPDITDVNRRTALHFCAGNGLPTVCKKLIDMGANLNIQDILGFTPLHMAAGYKKANTVRQLIDAGADANIASLQGQLPVEIAENIFEKTPAKKFFVPNEEHSRMRMIVDILDNATEYEDDDTEDGETVGGFEEYTEEVDSAKFVVRVKPKGKTSSEPAAPPPPPSDVQVTIRVKEPDGK